ncbi:MAG: zf-HC2 domain-containing protein [Planctomycetota bacterium]|nr:zf-HC2 domain-containing protein [Planctomycetota bacterium]
MGTIGCDCETAAMLTALEASGELDAGGRARLEAHISTCAACRSERERTLETARLLEEAVAWAGLRDGADPFRAAVLSRLDGAGLRDAPVADADGNIVPAGTADLSGPGGRADNAGPAGGAGRRIPGPPDRTVPGDATAGEGIRAAARDRASPVIFREGPAASRRRWLARRLLPAAAAVAALAAGWVAVRRLSGPEPAPVSVGSGVVLAGDSPVAAGGMLAPGGIEYRVAGDSPAVLRCGSDAAVRLTPGAVFLKPTAPMFGRAADIALLEGTASVHAGPSAGIAVEAAGASISGRGDFLVSVPARRPAAGQSCPRPDGGAGRPAEDRPAWQPEPRGGGGIAEFLAGIFAAHAAEIETPPERGPEPGPAAGRKRPAAELIVIVLSGRAEVSRAGAAGPARIGRHEAFVVSPWLTRAEWSLPDLLGYLRREEEKCLLPAPGTRERRELDSYMELVETYSADLARLERAASESGGAGAAAAADARDRAGRIREYLEAHRRRVGELEKRYAAKGPDPARGAAMRELQELISAALEDGPDRTGLRRPGGRIAPDAERVREALDACLRRLREALERGLDGGDGAEGR